MKWECKRISHGSAAGPRKAIAWSKRSPAESGSNTSVQAIGLDGIRAAMIIDGPYQCAVVQRFLQLAVDSGLVSG